MFQSFQLAIFNFIKQADQFGAVFRPTIKLKTQQYKTIQGGIISIIIYGLSLAYFAYGIHQWATNKILPNIVQQKLNNDLIIHQSSDKLMSIEYDVTNGVIDPFDRSNIILLVLIQEYQDGQPFSEITRIKQTDGIFYASNMTLTVHDEEKIDMATREMVVFISPCTQEYLEDDEQCTSKSLIQQYWNQSNYLLVRFYFQEYNTNLRSIEELSNLYYISLSEDLTYMDNLYLQQTITKIDQGILFPDFQQYSFISEISHQTQSISLQSGTKLYHVPNYIAFYFAMDTLQIQQNIAFANISSVLANIGSIVSSLLFFSYIAILINQKSLEDEAIFDVIKMYYPEFNKLIVKKNWLGTIQSIQNQQTNLFYDVKEFKQYYEKLAYVAEQKLCMSNMIYELSRIQFAIQSLMPKDQMVKLRDKCLKIQMQQRQTQREFKSPNLGQIQPSEQNQKIQKLQVLKDDELNKQPSYCQIYPSNDRELRIHKIQDDGQDAQQIDIDCQYKLDTNHEIEISEEEFDIFCINRYQGVKK